MWISYKGKAGTQSYQVSKKAVLEAVERYRMGDTEAKLIAHWKGFYSHGTIEIPVGEVQLGWIIEAEK